MSVTLCLFQLAEGEAQADGGQSEGERFSAGQNANSERDQEEQEVLNNVFAGRNNIQEEQEEVLPNVFAGRNNRQNQEQEVADNVFAGRNEENLAQPASFSTTK